MELVIALVLFIGLLASWLMLPGTTGTSVEVEPEATGLGRTTVAQGA